MRKIVIVGLGLMLMFACSKDPGEGGKNTIEGVIIMQEFSDVNGQFIIDYPALEERVYIIYGDNAYFADETRTNFDGTFRFPFLYKGDYQIFVYSDCLACPSGQEAIFIDVELTERKETFVTDTIFIKKY